MQTSTKHNMKNNLELLRLSIQMLLHIYVNIIAGVTTFDIVRHIIQYQRSRRLYIKYGIRYPCTIVL